jgi:hypothetical protein
LPETIGKAYIRSCLITQDEVTSFYVQQAAENYSTLARQALKADRMPDCFFSVASSALNGYWLSITTQGCSWKTPKFCLSSRLNSILDTDMQAFQDFQFKIDVNPLDLCPTLAEIGLLPSSRRLLFPLRNTC